MCTSFTVRGNKTIVGMNFDSGDIDYKIVLKNNNEFVIMVNVKGKYFTSFGINSSGTFVNDLMVDSNGKGSYKRQSKNRWITTTLIENVLSEKIEINNLKNILSEIEIVNSPFTSTHNMIVDKQGNVTIVEPGRKILHNKCDESPFYIMTNFALSDFEDKKIDEVEGIGADRYKKTHQLLLNLEINDSIESCFNILEKVKQDTGKFATNFSIVALPQDKLVFFSIKGDFEKRYVFSFEDLKIKTDKGFDEIKELSLPSTGITLNDIQSNLG
ncbi:hypothetical protein CLPU_4c01240 [Gottschalkia purinilytica]|uniref:Choloylglycine hydrolase n=1 Tax=Gottschalkia purinilytica TaxID=1503 RepID=A0A0L0WC82_GOTPU|nr:hypothetical protein [Gottschalkia purinilytica]KNF09078.1 hypothetical protein CLPU_4c01240 [Gottschalkia purinilytica]